MAVKETRLVDRFQARSEDGTYQTTILISQDFLDAGSFDNPNATIPGLKTVRTADGYSCNVKGDDTFEVVNHPFRPSILLRRVR